MHVLEKHGNVYKLCEFTDKDKVQYAGKDCICKPGFGNPIYVESQNKVARLYEKYPQLKTGTPYIDTTMLRDILFGVTKEKPINTLIYISKKDSTYNFNTYVPNEHVIAVKNPKSWEVTQKRIKAQFPLFTTSYTPINSEDNKEFYRFINLLPLWKDNTVWIEYLEEVNKKRDNDRKTECPLAQREKMLRKLPKEYKYFVRPNVTKIGMKTMVIATCCNHSDYRFEAPYSDFYYRRISCCSKCKAEGNRDVLEPWLRSNGSLKRNAPESIKQYYYELQLPAGFDYEFPDKITSLCNVKYICKNHAEITGTKRLDKLKSLTCKKCGEIANTENDDWLFEDMEERSKYPDSGSYLRKLQEDRDRVDEIIATLDEDDGDASIYYTEDEQLEKELQGMLFFCHQELRQLAKHDNARYCDADGPSRNKKADKEDEGTAYIFLEDGVSKWNLEAPDTATVISQALEISVSTTKYFDELVALINTKQDKAKAIVSVNNLTIHKLKQQLKDKKSYVFTEPEGYYNRPESLQPSGWEAALHLSE